MATKRTSFNETTVSAREALDALAPRPVRNKCAAIGCFLAGSVGNWCAYHAGARATDFGRVTSVLNQHHALRDAVVKLRQLSVDAEVDPETRRNEFRRIRNELEAVGYVVKPDRETMYGWQYAIETLLGGYVNSAMTSGGPRGKLGT